MTSKHTPGPWTIETPSKGSPVPIIHGADYSEVASVFSDDGEEGRHANARLIAAAPETAAERDRLKEINTELLAALEAIAARYPGEHGLDLAMRHGLDAELLQVRAALAKARVEG